MFGTCTHCEATCKRVFLVRHGDTGGMCAACIAVVFPPVWHEADLHPAKHRRSMQAVTR